MHKAFTSEAMRKTLVEDLRIVKSSMALLLNDANGLDFQASNGIWMAYGQLRTAIASLEDDKVKKKVVEMDSIKQFKQKTFQESLKES